MRLNRSPTFWTLTTTHGFVRTLERAARALAQAIAAHAVTGVRLGERRLRGFHENPQSGVAAGLALLEGHGFRLLTRKERRFTLAGQALPLPSAAVRSALRPQREHTRLRYEPSGTLDGRRAARDETHATLGASLLDGGESTLLRRATTIALSHHEPWDGNGYPRRLRADEIPLDGRIVAVLSLEGETG